MNRPRMLGFVAATAAASSLAASSPAEAVAATRVSGTIRPLARSCAAPRVAHFRIVLRHAVAGKRYTVVWTAPNRSGGMQYSQIVVVPDAARYVEAKVKSRAAAPLLRRAFETDIKLQVRRKGQDVTVRETTATVPACTRRV